MLKSKQEPITQRLRMKINRDAITPIYEQIARAVFVAIVKGELLEHVVLPSIHEWCSVLDVSKSTMERAYKLLKAAELVGSRKGKGYYVLGKAGSATNNWMELQVVFTP